MLAKWNGKLIAVIEFNSIPALKHGPSLVQKRIPPLRGLFNKSPAGHHANYY